MFIYLGLQRNENRTKTKVEGYFKFGKILDLIIFEPRVPVPPNNKISSFKKTPTVNYIFIFWNFKFFI